jgi:drug/metabolite transporter (DMT)-like permease
MTPMSFCVAVFFWSWPTLIQLAWLAVIGITGTLAQFLMAQAFRVADASLVLPLDFTKVAWGAIIAWLWFGEVVGIWTWVGALVIFSSATYIAIRERKMERAKSGADA